MEAKTIIEMEAEMENVFEPAPIFRWLVAWRGLEKNRLQQKWVDMENGKFEWRDVPTVYELDDKESGIQDLPKEGEVP